MLKPLKFTCLALKALLKTLTRFRGEMLWHDKKCERNMLLCRDLARQVYSLQTPLPQETLDEVVIPTYNLSYKLIHYKCVHMQLQIRSTIRLCMQEHP